MGSNQSLAKTSSDEESYVDTDVDHQKERKDISRKSKKATGAFRTISEVADELDVQQHVLRFWETRFSQVRPLKRGGGRRYYRPEDVLLLKKIHHLLYTEGYTIKGVQKLLKGQSKSQILVEEKKEKPKTSSVVKQVEAPANNTLPTNVTKLSGTQKVLLESMLAELKAMRDLLKA